MDQMSNQSDTHRVARHGAARKPAAPRFLLMCAFLSLVICTQSLSWMAAAATGEQADARPLRWLTSPIYGEETKLVIDEVNRLLTQSGVPIILTPCAPNGGYGYFEFVKLQIESYTEDYDVVNLTSEFGFIQYAQAGLLCDLSPMLAEYPLVSDTIRPELWEMATFGDCVFGAPADVTFGGNDYSLTLLASEWEDYPTDPEQLLDWITWLNASEGAVLVDTGGTTESEPPYFLHYTYAQWPFEVDNGGLFYFDGEGNVSPYIESPAFEQDSQWMAAFRDAGVLISPDKERGAEALAGVLRGFSPLVFDHISDYKYMLFGGGIEATWPADEARMYRAVPVSADPELFFQFSDWLYSDLSNYDLITEGIRDMHYTQDEIDGLPEPITDPKTGFPLYLEGANFDAQHNLSLPRGEARRRLYEEYGVDPDSEAAKPYYGGPVMPYTDFVFDPEPVQKEYDAVLRVMWGGLFQQILDGFEPYSRVDEAIDEMSSAGLDVVMAECEAQYEAYKLRWE